MVCVFAALVATYIYIAAGTVTMCWVYAAEIVKGTFMCDKDNRLLSLFETLLVAVGGYMLGKSEIGR